MELVRNRPPDDVPIFKIYAIPMRTSVVEEYGRRRSETKDLRNRISDT